MKKKRDVITVKLDLLVKANELFEDCHKSVEWFFYHNRALNCSPSQAVDEGREEEVENLIGRLEHGVFT